MVHQVKFGIADRMKGSGADSLRNCENADLTEKKTIIMQSVFFCGERMNAMTKREALKGKPYAGNPHVRFDEGKVASTTPRRGSLLYTKVKTLGLKMRITIVFAAIAFLGNFTGSPL